MAITSYGYAATIAANAPWALMQYTLGQEYFVLDGASARVTPVSTGTREVDIAAGYFGGQGVLDYNSAPFRLQLPTVASGTTYFLIVARRTWSTTQATSFVAIPAGTSATLPARNTSPGVLDDQPIALVPLTAGQTVPGAPIDLRVIGSKNGTYFAMSTLVLNYLTRIGTVVRIGTNTYTRIVNSSYVASWEKNPGAYARVGLPTGTAGGLIVTAAGWTAGSPMVNVGVLDGNAVSLDLQVRRTGAAIGSSAQGNFADSLIGTISTAYRPRRRRMLPTMIAFAGSSTERVSYGSGLGLSYLDPNGNWTLASGMPSIWITPPTNTAVVSIWASADFLREDATPEIAGS